MTQITIASDEGAQKEFFTSLVRTRDAIKPDIRLLVGSEASFDVHSIVLAGYGARCVLALGALLHHIFFIFVIFGTFEIQS
jgi:hypothetical protein